MMNGNNGNLGDMSMMDLFRMEAENQCDQLSEDLLALEQEPSDSSLQQSLMRAAHSIKGAARVVGLDPVVRIAHALEEVFVAAQDRAISLDQESIGLMLQGVDMLKAISQVPDTGTEDFFAEQETEISSLVDSFIMLAKGEKPDTETGIETPVGSVETTDPQPETPEIEATELPIDLSDMSMLDLFRMEAENHCTSLTEDIIALENDPTSHELLESMMRASHSMKGAAKIVELNGAVKLAHAMEDVFIAAQNERIIINRDISDCLLKSVDLLTVIANIPAEESGKLPADHDTEIDELVNRLQYFAGQETAEKQTLPPPKQPEKTPDPEPQQTEIKEVIEKTAEPPPKHGKLTRPARRVEDKNGLRAVRVSAQNMDRMMGLAGESLIESRW
ncbi:MAG: Hpt domain-containing protein, partial [Desulfobulbales bacterium]|nr:Hpt domain-containing protein [Desulfobulbales bacterium]